MPKIIDHYYSRFGNGLCGICGRPRRMHIFSPAEISNVFRSLGRDIEQAEKELLSIAASRRRYLRAFREDGYTVAQIAELAGVHRSRIYQMLKG